eukprot:scaffold31437_cov115-Amphora_coffeaeformis.AAC.1
MQNSVGHSRNIYYCTIPSTLRVFSSSKRDPTRPPSNPPQPTRQQQQPPPPRKAVDCASVFLILP